MKCVSLDNNFKKILTIYLQRGGGERMRKVLSLSENGLLYFFLNKNKTEHHKSLKNKEK